MRPSEKVLGMIHDRGQRGLPLYDLYRQLYNPDLYLRAYSRLYSRKGAMTPGVTTETVDGMSQAKIEAMIQAIRHECYHWTPVRRTYIRKKNGKKRPLGLPTWSDKLLQEVIRSLLEAYYEPQFASTSHGFRPGRGCHTALSCIQKTWKGTHWFIEADISQCFERIDHQILLAILAETIPDQRFLRLMKYLLQAGYMEEWRYHHTWSGCPQGGVISPLLANIYLDRMDRFVQEHLLPQYNRGTRRKNAQAYTQRTKHAATLRKQGKYKEAKAMSREAQQLPSVDPNDPHYRRLRYVRYADDVLLGFSGPKSEAEAIKSQLATFLHEHLKLELSWEKTLITHAATQEARFLGYGITRRSRDDKLTHDGVAQAGKRGLNGSIGLRIPAEVIQQKCAQYRQGNHPARRRAVTHDSDFTIMSIFQGEYRGLVNYYQLADNIGWLTKVHWAMKQSLLHTLAMKHQSSARAMYHRYKASTETPYGPMRCLQIIEERGANKRPLVVRYGGIPLRPNKEAILVEAMPPLVRFERSELLQRLRADQCELCGSREHCEVHHIRKLADINKKGEREQPIWMQKMRTRRRKTLVVCQNCHQAIHQGKAKGPLSQT